MSVEFWESDRHTPTRLYRSNTQTREPEPERPSTILRSLPARFECLHWCWTRRPLLRSNSSQRFLIGLRSAVCAGPSSSSTSNSVGHVFTDQEGPPPKLTISREGNCSKHLGMLGIEFLSLELNCPLFYYSFPLLSPFPFSPHILLMTHLKIFPQHIDVNHQHLLW